MHHKAQQDFAVFFYSVLGFMASGPRDMAQAGGSIGWIIGCSG